MDSKSDPKHYQDSSSHRMNLTREDIERIAETVAKKTFVNFFSKSTKVAVIAFFMTLFVWFWVISLVVSMIYKQLQIY